MITPICQACGKQIPKQRGWKTSYYQSRLFCDMECRSKGRPAITDDYEVAPSGCWEWKGHVDRNGYGKAYDSSQPKGSRVDWAHRVSYRLRVGPIPKGHDLDHVCCNTICINPEHLEPVTRTEHARRTMQRAGKDELHLRAATLRRSGMTYAEIAEALRLADKQSAHAAVQAAIAKGLVNADAVPKVRNLTDDDREDIRLLNALGIPQAEISAWYEIDNSQISRIVNGRTSGHGRGEAA